MGLISDIRLKGYSKIELNEEEFWNFFFIFIFLGLKSFGHHIRKADLSSFVVLRPHVRSRVIYFNSVW